MSCSMQSLHHAFTPLSVVPSCHHAATPPSNLPASRPPLQGRVIEEPPQTASLTFNPAGEVSGYTMGYVMDRVSTGEGEGVKNQSVGHTFNCTCHTREPQPVASSIQDLGCRGAEPACRTPSNVCTKPAHDAVDPCRSTAFTPAPRSLHIRPLPSWLPTPFGALACANRLSATRGVWAVHLV